MKSNNSLKLVLSIIGAVVVIGALVVSLIHFWDDLKKLIPCNEREELPEEFDDIEI